MDYLLRIIARIFFPKGRKGRDLPVRRMLKAKLISMKNPPYGGFFLNVLPRSSGFECPGFPIQSFRTAIRFFHFA